MAVQVLQCRVTVPPAMRQTLAFMLGAVLSGCAIYPLNREYDARILESGAATLNVGISMPEKKDRFRDSAAVLPKSFIAGYSSGVRASDFFRAERGGLYSAFLNRLELGAGGVPVPYLFTLNAYAKYNVLRLPTHTFVSVFTNVYGAQLVAEYEGYALRGGGILTQELYRNARTNVAMSAGLRVQKDQFAFYEAVKTDSEPDNITRFSRGMYVPFSVIVAHKSLYLQCSVDHALREKNHYTISVYPEAVKSIPYIGADPRRINLSMGFKGPF